MGIGYDNNPDYLPFIATNVSAEMNGVNTSAYLRIRFEADGLGDFGRLILRMRYDDGFIAYLNGNFVAGAIAPENPDWQSGATMGQNDAEAMVFQTFDLGPAAEWLTPGENVLAIHGLNHLITSSDFLMAAELFAMPRITKIKHLREGAAIQWTVPVDASEDAAWQLREFNDSAWQSGNMGIGYDTGPDYLPHIVTDVTEAMQNINTSVYLRARFHVANPEGLGTLTLRMKYDDGFVAYLNGTQVASEAAPEAVDWQSASSVNQDDVVAILFKDIEIGDAEGLLVPGENVLAIHGLNARLTSSDFLVSAEIVSDDGTNSDLPLPPGLEITGSGGVTPTSATIRGELASTAVDATTAIYAVWARRDHGRAAAAWPKRRLVGLLGDDGKSFEKTLRNLGPGVQYFFRFYAINAGGTAWSGASSFTTDARAPVVFVSGGSPVRALVPSSADEATGWQQADYPVGASWLSGSAGVGFDRDAGLGNVIGLDVDGAMFLVNGGVYIRHPFLVVDPYRLTSLTLRMKYDDGFVAYLNGTEIARANAPSNTHWNSVATETNDAMQSADFDITAFLDRLAPGENMLAVHGLNRQRGDSDFLILPELTADGDPGQPEAFELWAIAYGLSGAAAARTADSMCGRVATRTNTLVRLLTGSATRT
ncbi:MAG: fibronectin type III domain-containing protein, partial [Verrucomicrobiales bacterium]|nr:fibronectin type III domain-containing protein [Verrucomicrobiales bacterium]